MLLIRRTVRPRGYASSAFIDCGLADSLFEHPVEIIKPLAFYYSDFSPHLKLEGDIFFHGVGSSRSDPKSMTMRQYRLAIPLTWHSLSQHETGFTARH